MNLTKEQMDIVHHNKGHAKVMAVAGSGKTTTMIERILYLIKKGQDPKRILVLMFNSSASNEFKLKLEKRALLENIDITILPEVRTFHGMALKLCKYMESNEVLPKMKLETRGWVFSKMASEALSFFSTNKNSKMSKKESLEDIENFCRFVDLVGSDITSASQKLTEIPEITGSSMPSYFVEAYEKFEEMRKNNNIRFFTDIIKDPVMSIYNKKENKKYVQNIYDHIILDEYQDINEVQQRLTVFIAGNRAKVMAVGDADQCIYEWRGAKPEYIVDLFEDDFEDAVSYKLSRTYRYGDLLSMFVNNVITLNKNRDNKICISHDTTKATNVKYIEQNYNSDNNNLVKEINNHLKSGKKLSDIAILVRKFSMTINSEIQLIQNNIPYQLIGSDSVFMKDELMALEALIHLIVNDFDQVESSHLTNMLQAFFRYPYSGMTGIEIEDTVSKLLFNNEELASLPDRIKDVFYKTYQKNKNNFSSKKAKERLDAINDAISNKELKSYKIIKRYVKDVDLFNYFKKMSDSKSVAEEKEYLVNQFIKYAFITDTDCNNLSKKWINLFNSTISMKQNKDKITITSIHRSKGLEWSMVIIPNLDDEVFPGESKKNQIKESERRLFYVGATRAKDTLLLLHSPDKLLDNWERTKFEKYPLRLSFSASRFLFEGDILTVNKAYNLLKQNKKIDIKNNNLYLDYQNELNKNAQ